jgi:hypothetical protein
MRVHRVHSLSPLTPYEPSERPSAGKVRALVRQARGDGQLALPLELGPASPRAADPPPTAPMDRQFLGRMMTTILEACQGRRPAMQVRPLLVPELYARLLATEPSSRQPYVVRSVHTCRPADDVVETCAVVHCGPRALAVAARFETSPTGWRCTQFDLLKPRPPRARRLTA